MSDQVPDFVRADLQALGVELDEPTLEMLARYLDLLLEANTRMNLTAIRERDEAWRRLVIDSLTLLPGLGGCEPGTRLIDVGTGGGLPGMPVAIALPRLEVTLLDATGKKVRFLQECAQALGLPNVRAIQGRAETLGQEAEHRGQYDVAVSRAVGAMSQVLEYSLPLVKVGGLVLAMKGPRAEQELAQASDALSVLGAGDLEVFEAYPASFANELVIISLFKAHPTPAEYPRRPGVPKQEPL